MTTDGLKFDVSFHVDDAGVMYLESSTLSLRAAMNAAEMLFGWYLKESLEHTNELRFNGETVIKKGQSTTPLEIIYDFA